MTVALRSAMLGLLALLAIWATPATGHFNLNLNVRILHVERVEDGLRIQLRMPMPYVVAGAVGPVGSHGLPRPAPFTTNRLEDGRVVHLVDWAAVAADKPGLAAMASEGLHIEIDDRRLAPTDAVVRVSPIDIAPGFATLAEAHAALNRAPAEAGAFRETYVGDALIDLQLDFATGDPVTTYALSFDLDPGLPGQEETANLILDYAGGDPTVRRLRGLMTEPVEISTAAASGAITFVVEGVRHILGGLDHVLFVICLVLGAVGLRGLLARITGFTVGHSVTLSAGFFGYAPSGAWFAPAVETGIALSIVYAAAISLAPRTRAEGTGRIFAVTTAIGLLHGLGFSFMLHEILRVDAPNIWQSLLAFNVGVELGQVLIVAVAWPALALVGRLYSTTAMRVRQGVASLCIVVALIWTVERVLATAHALA